MNEIKALVQKAIKNAFTSIEIPDFNIEYADEKFGDFSTNVAMILSRIVGKSPQEIANTIINSIEKGDIIESVTVAKPGFINFKMTLPFWHQKISEILTSRENYAQFDLGKDLKVNIEFISANPTGPLTLGNGRGAYVGDVLANILTAFGAEVEREYYINDRGAQIITLGHSVLKDDQAVYRGQYIDDLQNQIFHYHTFQYRSGKPEEIGQLAAAIIMEGSIKKTILKMGIKFDYWLSENALFKGPVEEIMEILKRQKLTYGQDSALWIKTTDNGDDKDRVLVTSEGEYTYFAADLAYHWVKMKRGYNSLIDIWGADHHGYIGRMKAGIEILKKELKEDVNFEILIAQLVRLISQGKEVKMSKRAGTYVTLDELLNEVGPDATRFFFLERALNTHMDFDLDLAKEQSQKNPVYYVQYAYARIASILAKLKTQNSKLKTSTKNLKPLNHPAEISLIKELVKLPDLILEIVNDYQVQKLPFYAVALANAFHNFYEKCPVLKADDKLKEARLSLILATQIVLKTTLDLMGISAPRKM